MKPPEELDLENRLVDQYNEWADTQDLEIEDNPRNTIIFLIRTGYIKGEKSA